MRPPEWKLPGIPAGGLTAKNSGPFASSSVGCLVALARARAVSLTFGGLGKSGIWLLALHLLYPGHLLIGRMVNPEEPLSQAPAPPAAVVTLTSTRPTGHSMTQHDMLGLITDAQHDTTRCSRAQHGLRMAQDTA